MSKLCMLVGTVAIVGLLTTADANADKVDDGARFIANHMAAGGARSCGDILLVQQLRTATLQYYALHHDSNDLRKFGTGFDSRVSLILLARGDKSGSEHCLKTELPNAREELKKTQDLINKHSTSARNKTWATMKKVDELESLNELVLECKSGANQIGKRIYYSKIQGKSEDATKRQFQLHHAIWPERTVTAIYEQSTDADDAGRTAQSICLIEANARLARMN